MTITSHQPTEKRNTIRVTPEPDYPVGIDLTGSGFMEATTAVNVSKEGISIKLPDGLKASNLDGLNKMLIKLPKPVEHSFTTTVRIIHQKDGNFGALFEVIKKNDANKLHSYIEKRLKQLDGDELLKIIQDE